MVYCKVSVKPIDPHEKVFHTDLTCLDMLDVVSTGLHVKKSVISLMYQFIKLPTAFSQYCISRTQ